MNSSNSNIEVRAAVLSDAHELCAILNEIICIGGTTASEIQLTDDEFRDRYFRGDDHISCYSALDEQGTLAGFQSLKLHPNLPNDWADIATFARIETQIAGIGTALFEASRNYAKESGVRAINARIRADNVGGLRFYDKLGFETYSVNAGVPLNSGVKVDRICKRFDLA